MPIHVRIWTGSGSARVTDMTFAGKRGKRCRTVRLSGYVHPDHFPHRSDTTREAHALTAQALDMLTETDAGTDFDRVRLELLSLVAWARTLGVGENWLAVYEEEIRGVDAPRPKLTAGKEGLWEASATEEGITLRDLADTYNEWTELTHGQTGAAAYAIAVKVWPRVQAASSLHDAASILRAAGAKLHGYCAVD